MTWSVVQNCLVIPRLFLDRPQWLEIDAIFAEAARNILDLVKNQHIVGICFTKHNLPCRIKAFLIIIAGLVTKGSKLPVWESIEKFLAKVAHLAETEHLRRDHHTDPDL